MKIPRPEHPRPDMQRSDWLNLNGPWQLAFDPGQTGAEQHWPTKDKFDKEIVVPFCLESSLGGLGYKDFMPALWYHRTFQIPETWNGRRILLHGEACDYFSRVYINGQSLGEHRGGYTPFSVDITAAIQRGENSLVIEVQDDLRSYTQPYGKQSDRYDSYGCSYTRVTGIWQTVWLEAVPSTYIGQFKIITDADNGLVALIVTAGGDKAEGNLTATVFHEGTPLAAQTVVLHEQPVIFQIKLPEVVLWQPGRPFLYDLKLSLKTSGGCDEVNSYFGIRKISIKGRKIYLNDQPLYLRMVLDQGYYPDGIYTAPTEEALKHDIGISMAAGFNGARLHQKIFEPRFIYWADKMGYLLWGEAGNWKCDFNNPKAVINFIDEWTQVLTRDYNHPSIIGWCPLNETRSAQGKLPQWLHRHLYELNKMFDPHRPAIDTSGYIHYPGVGSDLYDVHNYAMPRELETGLEHLKHGEWTKAFKNFPQDVPYDGNKPYFVSEFGGIGWDPRGTDNGWGYGDRPKSEQEFIDRYVNTVQVLLDNPEICGWCYTQLYDIEQEVNGLYYYDRKPKFNPDIMKKIYRVNSAPAKYLA